MKKLFLTLVLAISAIVIFDSCKKEQVVTEEPNPNAEKIIGSWNLDDNNTYMVRLYTSAEGSQKADTIPLSTGGATMIYTFGNDGVLVQSTVASDGSSCDRSCDYVVKGTDLIFNGITHIIRTLDEKDLTFEQVEDHDYDSGEHLRYTQHFEFHKTNQE